VNRDALTISGLMDSGFEMNYNFLRKGQEIVAGTAQVDFLFRKCLKSAAISTPNLCEIEDTRSSTGADIL